MIETLLETDRKQKESPGNPRVSGENVAGAEGFAPSARGFGVDVEKALADIEQPIFRAVKPFVIFEETSQDFLMLY